MSTSALVAQSDLLKQLPSCSYNTTQLTPTDLDVYSWARIFETVASSVPLRQALEFKTLHSEAYSAVNRAFRKVTKLKISIIEGRRNEKTVYFVQNSPTKNPETAVEMVRFVLRCAKNVRHLELYFEDPNLETLNEMMDAVIESENVHLESFRVKRRHAGQSVTKIGDVIRANAATLREISRVGISEASHGFNDQVFYLSPPFFSPIFPRQLLFNFPPLTFKNGLGIGANRRELLLLSRWILILNSDFREKEEINLERFGCMSFDLGFQPIPGQIPLHMIRLTESGAKFKSLSYTSFSGFDPTAELVQNLLDGAQVEELKLTMMNAPNIASRPGYLIGKIRSVKRLELVEIVPEPQRINKLLSVRHVFENVFPNCHENVFFLQQWE